jgi:hypothetical protein
MTDDAQGKAEWLKMLSDNGDVTGADNDKPATQNSIKDATVNAVPAAKADAEDAVPLRADYVQAAKIKFE